MNEIKETIVKIIKEDTELRWLDVSYEDVAQRILKEVYKLVD